MQTSEALFLIIIAIGAGFYLYRKLFKTGGCSCGCGNKSCHPAKPKKKN